MGSLESNQHVVARTLPGTQVCVAFGQEFLIRRGLLREWLQVTRSFAWVPLLRTPCADPSSWEDLPEHEHDLNVRNKMLPSSPQQLCLILQDVQGFWLLAVRPCQLHLACITDLQASAPLDKVAGAVQHDLDKHQHHSPCGLDCDGEKREDTSQKRTRGFKKPTT